MKRNASETNAGSTDYKWQRSAERDNSVNATENQRSHLANLYRENHGYHDGPDRGPKSRTRA